VYFLNNLVTNASDIVKTRQHIFAKNPLFIIFYFTYICYSFAVQDR